MKDDRRDPSKTWTLNGRVSDLVSGSNTIAATNLGWAPVKVSGPGTQGADVVAASGDGLSTDKPLATGPGSADRNVETVVHAVVSLKVPTSAAGGDYTGTLTLTLI